MKWHLCIVIFKKNFYHKIKLLKSVFFSIKAATEKNEIDAVRCLCLAGLDLSITNKDGLTAEQLALGLRHINIANLLSSLRRVSKNILIILLIDFLKSGWKWFFGYSLLLMLTNPSFL